MSDWHRLAATPAPACPSPSDPHAMAPPPPAANHVPLHSRMVLGALSGMGAATFCHPLDVVRVNMQVAVYKNTLDAASSIFLGVRGIPLSLLRILFVIFAIVNVVLDLFLFFKKNE